MSIEDLLEALRGGDRKGALEALAALGDAAIEPLTAALLRSADPDLRRGAAYVLGDVDDLRVIPALLEALERDEDAEVRLWVVDSLKGREDARTVEPLIVALNDPVPAVREEAARALGAIGEAVGGTRISGALAVALGDSDWGTRQSAAEMLIRLGADGQTEADRLLMLDLENEDAEIRLGAAWSLLELGDELALEPLVRLLYHHESQIAAAAARGLGLLGNTRAVVPLNAALKHADADVREAAQDALRRLGAAD